MTLYIWNITSSWVKEDVEEFTGEKFFVERSECRTYRLKIQEYPGFLYFKEMPGQCAGLIFEGDEMYHDIAYNIALYFKYVFMIYNNTPEEVI